MTPERNLRVAVESVLTVAIAAGAAKSTGLKALRVRAIVVKAALGAVAIGGAITVARSATAKTVTRATAAEATATSAAAKASTSVTTTRVLTVAPRLTRQLVQLLANLLLGLLQHVNQFICLLGVVARKERVRSTLLITASSTADSVHVILTAARIVEIDYVLNVVHI